MWRLLLMRLIQFPLLLWIIYTVTFLMAVTIPGNPFSAEDKTLNEDVERAVMAKFNADDNSAFYWQYLGNLFNPLRAMKGEGPLIDLGPSWQYVDWNCNQIVAATLPVSAGLGLLAMLLAVMIGVPVGVVSAVRRNSVFDYASLGVVLIGISLPTFVTGTALLILFAINLSLLPVEGWGSLSQMVLPALTLSLPFMAYIARLTRLGMLDVMGSDYIRTARAKGLPERSVVWTHALKNAFLPVLSYLGPATAQVLTGSFIIESIFNIPGMGKHFVEGVLNRDRAIILATVMVFSTLIIVFNMIVDLAYALVDPRIDLDKE